MIFSSECETGHKKPAHGEKQAHDVCVPALTAAAVLWKPEVLVARLMADAAREEYMAGGGIKEILGRPVYLYR